jgi:hypothetical protein
MQKNSLLKDIMLCSPLKAAATANMQKEVESSSETLVGYQRIITLNTECLEPAVTRTSNPTIVPLE